MLTRMSSRGKTRSSVGPGIAGGGRALAPRMEKSVGGRGGGTPKYTSLFGMMNSMFVGSESGM